MKPTWLHIILTSVKQIFAWSGQHKVLKASPKVPLILFIISFQIPFNNALAKKGHDFKKDKLLLVREIGPKPTYTFTFRGADGGLSDINVTEEEEIYKATVNHLRSLELYDESIFRFSRMLKYTRTNSSLRNVLEEKIQEFLNIPLEKLEKKIGWEAFRKLDYKEKGTEALNNLITEKHPHVQYFLRLVQIGRDNQIHNYHYRPDFGDEIDAFFNSNPDSVSIIEASKEDLEQGKVSSNFPVSEWRDIFLKPSPFFRNGYIMTLLEDTLFIYRNDRKVIRYFENLSNHFLDSNYSTDEFQENLEILIRALELKIVDPNKINFSKLFHESTFLDISILETSIKLLKYVPVDLKTELLLGITRSLFEEAIFTGVFDEIYKEVKPLLLSLDLKDSRVTAFFQLDKYDAIKRKSYVTTNFPKLTDLIKLNDQSTENIRSCGRLFGGKFSSQ